MCDVSTDGRRLKVQRLLVQYDFKKVMRDLYESTAIGDTPLTRLKRDIDHVTGYYDNTRFYQYPVQSMLADHLAERETVAQDGGLLGRWMREARCS